MTSQERLEKAETVRLARIARISMVRELRDKGCNKAYIAQLLGISENTVRQICTNDLGEQR